MTAVAKKRKPAPFKLTMPEIPESAILNAVLEYLNYHPAVAWAQRMNSGGTKFKRADGTEQFVRFGFEGLSDVLGQLRDGRLLAIETKARKGRARASQIAFLMHVQKNNGVAGIARSVDDAIAILAGRRYTPPEK